MEFFGLRLKTLRLEKKLRQEELAEKIGVKKATISGYECGSKYPSVVTLNKMCDYLGVSADYLLGRTDDIACKLGNLTDIQYTQVMGIVAQLERYNEIISDDKKIKHL